MSDADVLPGSGTMSLSPHDSLLATSTTHPLTIGTLVLASSQAAQPPNHCHPQPLKRSQGQK